MKWLISAVFSLTSLLLASCSGSNVARQVVTPNIDLRCLPSQSNLCGALGQARQFRIGLVFSPSAVCSELILAAGSDFKQIFSISGEAESEFTGIFLRGTVSTLVDSSGQTLSEVSSGSYTLCGHLDENQNGLLDSGEPITQ